MNILDSLSRRKKKEAAEKQVEAYFKLMNAYTPAFTSFEGGVYEMELTRAAIHTFATHCSKLQPTVTGRNNESFERKIQFRMNPHMATSQYLYKLATLFMTDNTAFIVPLYEADMKTICGYYPLKASNVTPIMYKGREYFRFQFNGGRAALEREKVGIMNQFLYKSDFFGQNNDALFPTMDLIHANNKGIIEGVKRSANVRFLAKLAMTLAPNDMEEERKRLIENNLGAENNGGVLVYDQKYEDIKQVVENQFTVNAAQMKIIRDNVYDYFGINEKILQNSFTSEEWEAYYEGKIEPFAIQASLVHTNVTYSDTALSYGNSIIFSADRMMYLSPSEKLQTVTQLFDRGFITHNEGLKIYNLSAIGPDGDKRYIRKEYAAVDELGKDEENGIDTIQIEEVQNAGEK